MYDPYPMDYPLRPELVGYCDAVLAGQIVACQKHRWACQRFLDDLQSENTDDFPFVFDEEAALLFLNWMKLFKHRKGVLAGQRIEPHVLQRFIFGNAYGWKHRETGYRRFRKVYWQVGRKNAKSQSLSCVASYELMALDDSVSEVYCAATKKDQARIVWDETKGMLTACLELQGAYRVAYGAIEHLRSGSLMKALSKEDRKEGDGFNPQCGIIDEYHAHDTAEIYDILWTGMGARPQPLLVIITTAGYELANPCYRVEYHYVSQILDPNNPITNDSYFVMINELDRDEQGELVDDITDEVAWEKANPILCSYQAGRDYLRLSLQEAQDVPEKMRTFLTKNMNVWVDQSAVGYMPMAKWKACCGQPPDLAGLECYIGIDLSAKIDLTSVAFEFPIDDKYVVLSHSFMPYDTLEAKRKTDKVPYDLWVKQGWITATDGAVVDYRAVMQYIIDQLDEHGWHVREICFDSWNATQFATDMADQGFQMVEIIQGIRTLAEPTKGFRDLVYQGRIIHDNNPVLTWAVGNAVTRSDHNLNIMLDKSKSRERIDPIAAVMNAHVRAVVHEPSESVYEKRGAIII